MTALHLAAAHGHEAVAAALLAQRANVHEKENDYGCGPVARRPRCRRLVHARGFPSPSFVLSSSLLLACPGLPPSAVVYTSRSSWAGVGRWHRRCCGRVTPLHDAASNGRVGLVEILLGHGADVNAQTTARRAAAAALIRRPAEPTEAGFALRHALAP